MLKNIRQLSTKQMLQGYEISFCDSSSTAKFSTQPVYQNIFDRNAKRLQKERAARNANVELYDYLKEEVGFRLADRIIDIKREFTNAADIGCSRGFLSKHIMAESVQHLTLCDTSPTMLEQAQGTPGLKMTKLEVDEEKLDFPENSLDLVISSLSLHWVNDLPGCFSKIIRSLQPDGVFIASLFGGDTLYELRSSLQLAEIERKGGLAPHISPFTQIRDVGALLNRAGFTMLTIDTDEIVVGFPSMFELMWDLKGMAENNAAFNRPVHISRETLLAASAIYKELYAKDDGVTATFQIIYFVGWKPSPNQPKPLERGTGEVSLKDLGKIIESGRPKKAS
ncbi:PREDICTED: NADH dehydrogenase [ubiquinone] 1 alpha subcomplex assembly factor 5 [Rhagoletis zephyria]|uniref:NADH dehydrogenase [ubiquinone] 1 alpha subcomplex assembly factor 5 n=1 Tax=Rhagoletis zephyria TaxID=28612 RepID=UPI0008118755|nr:PREDICTED: NADH dehydrogenase [ubiquinone] 1 alpha subcomplex assembly factor 5 [Rhagoletis zephyria]